LGTHPRFGTRNSIARLGLRTRTLTALGRLRRGNFAKVAEIKPLSTTAVAHRYRDNVDRSHAPPDTADGLNWLGTYERAVKTAREEKGFRQTETDSGGPLFDCQNARFGCRPGPLFDCHLHVEQLMALLAQFEIGVSRRAHDLLEIHETDPQDKSDST